VPSFLFACDPRTVNPKKSNSASIYHSWKGENKNEGENENDVNGKKLKKKTRR